MYAGNTDFRMPYALCFLGLLFCYRNCQTDKIYKLAVILMVVGMLVYSRLHVTAICIIEATTIKKLDAGRNSTPSEAATLQLLQQC